MDSIIEIKTKENEILQGELLFSFEANGDDFVIYAIDDVAYGAKMDEEGQLRQIEDDEWKIIEPLFEEYLKEQEDDDK